MNASENNSEAQKSDGQTRIFLQPRYGSV